MTLLTDSRDVLVALLERYTNARLPRPLTAGPAADRDRAGLPGGCRRSHALRAPRARRRPLATGGPRHSPGRAGILVVRHRGRVGSLCRLLFPTPAPDY